MSRMSTRRLFMAAAAVVLVTNAVVLGGAGWNRAGEPECVLMLSQRELHRPYEGGSRENSGLALKLAWRIPVRGDGDENGWQFAGSGGAPAWLDRAKMETLGFRLAAGASADEWRTERQDRREVLLVLELDGPAYRQAVQRSQRRLAEATARLAADPGSEAARLRARQAREEAQREEQKDSRLFAIDAGLDLAALRARYPDRGRYGIVRAQVRPWRSGASKPDLARGFVQGLSIDAINVPYDYLAPLEGAPPSLSFEARVAFGRRLEPWIMDLAVVRP